MTVFSPLACNTPCVRCPESRPTMIETLTAVRSTSLPPARQYHSDRLIPTLTPDACAPTAACCQRDKRSSSRPHWQHIFYVLPLDFFYYYAVDLFDFANFVTTLHLTISMLVIQISTDLSYLILSMRLVKVLTVSLLPYHSWFCFFLDFHLLGDGPREFLIVLLTNLQ